MDFKLPNNNFNENQIKLLENIQLSQKNILAQFSEAQFSDLNKRISKLEHSQQAVITEISHKNEPDESLSFSDRLEIRPEYFPHPRRNFDNLYRAHCSRLALLGHSFSNSSRQRLHLH